ncbi:MAG TPA: thioredoxin domain-containing protein [Pseudomonadota bacterium]|jgi:protein-disulfide isomerase|nr:thioredoxin domain-containing protein [Pseudomonadota bacterium]
MKRLLLSLSLLLLAPGCAKLTSRSPVASTVAGETVVAMIGTQRITLEELDKAAGRELFELRERTLENMISERVLKAEAQKAGLSEEAFIKQQVEKRVPEVSVETARKFFEENKSRLPPQLATQPFEQVQDTLVKGLTGQNRQRAVGEVIEEIKSRAGVKVLLAAPKVQVAASGPSKGPKDAKVTIVEFSDFQCPYCGQGRKVMEEVLSKYGNKVRVVFRDFPLSFHDKAQKAAEAGQCAHDQGKFWEMHDWMFDNQSTLDEPALKDAARKLGLNGDKFDACLTTGAKATVVKNNMKEGGEAGVKGTPAFFVNGVFLSGALPFEKFKTEIDRALAE